MSADLLAGLDPYYSGSKPNNGTSSAPRKNSTSTHPDLSFFEFPSTKPIAQQPVNKMDEGDDYGDDKFEEWGDFESPVASPPHTQVNTSSKQYGALDRDRAPAGFTPTKSVSTIPTRPRRLRASTEEFFSGKLEQILAENDDSRVVPPSPEKPTKAQPTNVRNRKEKSYTSEILFDADNVSADEDEFGDFETAPEKSSKQTPKQAPKQAPNLMDDDFEDMTTSMGKVALAYPQPHQLPPQPRPLTSREDRDLFNSMKNKVPLDTYQSSPSKTKEPKPRWAREAGERLMETHRQKRLQREAQERLAERARQDELQAQQAIRGAEANWDDPIEKGSKSTTKAQPQEDWDNWDEEFSPVKQRKAPVQSKPRAPVQRKPQTPVKPIIKTTPATPGTNDFDDDDSWSAWDTPQPKSAAPVQPSTPTKSPAPTPPPIDQAAPPTNIPPPSVLLAFIPDLLASLQTTIFSPGFKTKVATDASALASLRDYLAVGQTAARIIAGRKQRWKRDTLLGQSMRISQAGAGGKSGMKLVGVDRAETAREEREAADLAKYWKDSIGRLKLTVAAANAAIPDPNAHLTVPEINEVMPVRTANVAEGGLTAMKCCFLCGLKREERVRMVDASVEDSFGEWWVEFWGHRVCKEFWVRHSGKLRQR